MMPPNSPDEPKPTWLDKLANPKLVDGWALRLLRLAGALSLLIIAVVLAMGFWRMVEGSCEFFGVTLHEHEPVNRHAATAKLVSGLEFFLLAPLAYLQLRTLGNYVSQIQASAEGRPDASVTRALMSVKALSVGLLITILATHTVGTFLEAEGRVNASAADFPWIKIACSTGFLLALTAYFATLEYMCHDDVGHAEPGEKK